MKKLVLMFVAVAAMSFASCGNQAQQPAPVDTDTMVVEEAIDTLAEDSAAIDSVAAEVTDSLVEAE